MALKIYFPLYSVVYNLHPALGDINQVTVIKQLEEKEKVQDNISWSNQRTCIVDQRVDQMIQVHVFIKYAFEFGLGQRDFLTKDQTIQTRVFPVQKVLKICRFPVNPANNINHPQRNEKNRPPLVGVQLELSLFRASGVAMPCRPHGASHPAFDRHRHPSTTNYRHFLHPICIHQQTARIFTRCR